MSEEDPVDTAPRSNERPSTMIRALRQQLRWNRGELAHRASLDERTVLRMEQGVKVSERAFASVVDALNRGLREKVGQLGIPFAKLDISDLFHVSQQSKQRVGRALPAPANGEERRKAIRALMSEKAVRSAESPNAPTGVAPAAKAPTSEPEVEGQEKSTESPKPPPERTPIATATTAEFEINFAEHFSAQEVSDLLTALSEYYRAAGGVGFEVEFEAENVPALEPVGV
jgi:transcriptional regulator with XRE-family HTH domain